MESSKWMRLHVLVVFIFSFSLLSGLGVLKADTTSGLGGAFFDDLDTFDESKWHKAHNWGNGQMFNATWYDSQVTFDNSIMTLAIEMDEEGANPPYKAGEYRANAFYQYGLFEVNMKPAKSEGTVSSFFTYTGPSNDNPWDEIDIEFLGKDTTKIQFNYFTDGVGNNEYMHELGFDASEDFHTYAFEWRPDSISWYVNGELIHTATENIPQTPQQIMMNFWPAIGVDGWTGVFDETDIPIYTQYNWIKYTPLSELDNEHEEPIDNEDDEKNDHESPDESNNDETDNPGDDESTDDSNDNNTDGSETDGSDNKSKADEDGINDESDDNMNGMNEENGSTDESDDSIEGTKDDNENEVEVSVEDNDKMNRDGDTSGNRLPDTATPNYTYLLIGAIILFIGGYLYLRSTKIHGNQKN